MKVIALILSLFFLLALTTLSACQPDSGCFTQVNDSGFGDDRNHYAWSMAAFNGHLYVGTMNLDLWGWFNGLGPGDGIIDPLTEGAEVWRYDGSTWEQVVDNGFKGDFHNFGTRNLHVHDGMLYAGTVNYLDGCELWRTADGTDWEPVMQGGFCHSSTGSVRGMATYNGLLYVGVESLLRGGEIHSWDGETWTRVADGGIDNRWNISVAELVPWRDHLWVFTWNPFGFEVYTYDGAAFEPVCGFGAPQPAGFGQITNLGAMGVQVYNDRLYMGTANFLFGADMFRTDDGVEWVQLVNNGFCDWRQAYIWRMKEYRGDLYIGTFHEGHLGSYMKEGARIYRMDASEEFEQIVGPKGTLMAEGFGNDLNYGIRTLSVFDDKLFIGTAQCFFCPGRTGTEVWAYDPDDPDCVEGR